MKAQESAVIWVQAHAPRRAVPNPPARRGLRLRRRVSSLPVIRRARRPLPLTPPLVVRRANRAAADRVLCAHLLVMRVAVTAARRRAAPSN